MLRSRAKLRMGWRGEHFFVTNIFVTNIFLGPTSEFSEYQRTESSRNVLDFIYLEVFRSPMHCCRKGSRRFDSRWSSTIAHRDAISWSFTQSDGQLFFKFGHTPEAKACEDLSGGEEATASNMEIHLNVRELNPRAMQWTSYWLFLLNCLDIVTVREWLCSLFLTECWCMMIVLRRGWLRDCVSGTVSAVSMCCWSIDCDCVGGVDDCVSWCWRCLVMTWWLFDGCFDDCLMTVWWLLDDCVGCFDDCLMTAWWLGCFDDCLMTVLAVFVSVTVLMVTVWWLRWLCWCDCCWWLCWLIGVCWRLAGGSIDDCFTIVLLYWCLVTDGWSWLMVTVWWLRWLCWCDCCWVFCCRQC
jgi:hypothetical protein